MGFTIQAYYLIHRSEQNPALWRWCYIIRVSFLALIWTKKYVFASLHTK